MGEDQRLAVVPRGRARGRFASLFGSASVRVSAFSTILVIASLAVYLFAVRDLGSVGLPRGGIWWPVVALGFALAEVAVLHVEFRRNAHSMSLNEIPLLIGLAFLSPTHLLVAHLVGAAVVLAAYQRQPALKLFFNLSHFALEDCLAILVFYALVGAYARLGPKLWIAGFGAALVASAVGVLTVSAVIWLHQSRIDVRQVRSVFGVSAAGAMFNACVGLVAVTVLWVDVRGWILLAPIAVILGSAYRAYAALRQRHARLESLYQFTQVVGRAGDANAIVADVLAQARHMLKAETAELALLPDGTVSMVEWFILDGDASSPSCVADPSLHSSLVRLLERTSPVVCPNASREPEIRAHLAQRGQRDCIVASLIVNEHVIGLLCVANRLGDVATFDDQDGRLFATIAAQTSGALQNARLVGRLRHEALHDSLTDLANRVLLKQRLAEAIARRRPRDPEIAVMLIDLDRFKEINDTLGHDAGDLMLQEVAARLTRAVPERVTVARLGGDEFALLDPAREGTESALTLATLVRESLDQPFAYLDLELEVSATIGIALSPRDGDNDSTLLRRADIAMYAAKNTPAGVAVYTEELDDHNPRKLALVSELRSVIEQGGLELHYQPQMHIGTGTVIGAEALVRWPHPTEGLVPPDEFIPIAERTGLIGPLTDFVVHAALVQCRRWREIGWDLTVAVNLSARSLLDPELVERIHAALQRTGVSASSLVLEITETSVMAEPDRALQVLDQLAALGITLAVDDFGTGYSSLTYLKRLPVDEIKIDKSFVLNMHDDDNDAVIVRSTVELARNLGLRTIAEGVETTAAWNALLAIGCDVAQGYLISRPLPADRFDAWLETRPAQPTPILA